jgi:hypothetical protein
MPSRSQVLKKPRIEEKRAHTRLTAQFRSTFSGGQREGHGKTLDLSDGGCRIETDYPVVPNMVLAGHCALTRRKFDGSRAERLAFNL